MAAAPQGWQFSDDRLENGLRVLVLEERRAALANVQVWYHVGSKDEDPHRQGFAHLFEHMMFRGTDRLGPQDHFKYLSRYGAQVNGYTSFDQTVYWETVPATQVDLALWLEAERLGRLKINADYFAAEREVVKEERRMRYLNRPYGLLFETLYAAAYRRHPYRWTPIGNMPHLDAATIEEVRAFFARFYVPNNATLVVVGDVRRDEVLAKVREYFGPLPRRPDPPRVAVTEPPVAEPRRVEITDIAPSPRVIIAYHTPAAPDPRAVALEMLCRILSSGQSSRFYRRLVQGRELAVEAYAHASTLEQSGLLMLSATLKKQVGIEAGEQALLEEIKILLDGGIEPAELEKARNQALAEYIGESETVHGLADQLGYAAVILGDPRRINTEPQLIRAVTAEQIMVLARSIFRPEGRVTLMIRPQTKATQPEATEDKSAQAAQAIADLLPPKEMPAGRPPRPTALPPPVSRRLGNGLQVCVFSDHSCPAVTISFNALIGAKNDPADLPGLAFVTAGTLRRGTRRHSGDELAELIDAHGMSLAESVNHEDTQIRIWALSEHLDLAGRILAEVVREPAFPEKEVTGFAVRAAAREAINEKDPGTVAARALDGALFKEYYLARPAKGTSASLGKITPAAVANYHRANYAPQVSTLMFAGDITAERAFALANELFGDWAANPAPMTAVPPPGPQPLRILLVDRPGAVQSEIRLGQVVNLSRRDADYPAVRLVSQLFGESFSGRLNRALRIEKGLTYGARGWFDVRAAAASFKISTFTRTDKTAEAVRTALAAIDRLRAGNITADELGQARDNLIGGFQVNLETPADLAARYWDLLVWNLPTDWYTHYLRALAETRDLAALDRAAQARIDPARLTIVVVGAAAAVKSELEQITPVEIVANP